MYRPILNLYHTNVYYDNILDKFEFESSRAMVKVTVVANRLSFFLTLFHTNMKYDNILNNFEFEGQGQCHRGYF